MTRYVQSAERVQALMQRWATPAFLQSRVLSVSFETDPDLVAAVLPPPLEPDGKGIASVSVSSFGASNCVGPFDGGSLNVRARFGDLVGNYCVTMPKSTDTAVSFGRELYGEPKKLARIALTRQGRHVMGTVERHGITYITLRADLTEHGPPAEATGAAFHVKFTPRADGTGLDADPLLIHVSLRSVIRRIERGAGTIELADSPYDPVADFPVHRILSVAYTEGDVYTLGRVVASIPQARFLPYAFGKMDPMDAFDAGIDLVQPVAIS